MDSDQRTPEGHIERFLQAHNRVYNHLQDITRDKHSGSGFKDLVEITAGGENPLIQNYKEELISFNAVRNILVHDDTIADLKEEAIAEFERIADRICSPEKLLPKFRSDIDLFQPGDELMTVLEYMGEYDYSQIIIRHEGLLSLLTVEGISKWLESGVGAKTVDLTVATVGDALSHEIESSFVCMSSSRTVYAAQEAFAKAPEDRGSRLFAIIVTNTGSRAESPLGIVTPWDLVEVEL